MTHLFSTFVSNLSDRQLERLMGRCVLRKKGRALRTCLAEFGKR